MNNTDKPDNNREPNISYMIICERIVEKLRHEFPDMKLTKAKKMADQYLRYIVSVFARAAVRRPENGVYQFSLKKARLALPRFDYENKTRYVWDELFRIYPLFAVLDRGTNLKGTISMIRVFDEQLIDHLVESQAAEELIRTLYSDHAEQPCELVAIDQVSIAQLIMATELEIKQYEQIYQFTDRQKKHLTVLFNNRRIAKQIQLVSEYMIANSGESVIPHYKSDSEFGRTYYQSLNLQSAPKIVRRAAIGAHYQYDLSTAAYGIKLLLAEQIAREQNTNIIGKFTNTKMYVEHKNQYRKKLAKHIQAYPDPERLIKLALTAIGFGARLADRSYIKNNSTFYTAISDIIQNPDDRHRFYTDPWVIEFVQEQQDLTKMITDYYLADAEFIQRVSQIKACVDNRGIKRAAVMAYIYQHAETKIIQQLIHPQPCYFTLHDGWVSKQRYNLLELRTKLREIDPYGYLTIEEQHYDRFYSEHLDPEVIEHKNRIRQQEQLANPNWAAPVSDNNNRYYYHKHSSMREDLYEAAYCDYFMKPIV